MGETNFVPEMHDLGKLMEAAIGQVPTTDGRSLSRHGTNAFGNVDWANWGVAEPDTLTWAAIRHHHDDGREGTEDWRELPAQMGPDWQTRVAVFLTTVADHLASTAGRAVPERSELKALQAKSPEVYCLWNPGLAKAWGAPAFPIQNETQLRCALDLVRQPRQSFDDYRNEYGKSLLVKAEDMNPARRVTSLYSHLALVGQFYRVLRDAVEMDPNLPGLSLGGEGVRTVTDAEERWVGRLAQVQVRFHQQPVRPADLGVFDLLAECHRALEHAYPDHLLFRAADTLWLFLPGPEPKEKEQGISTGALLEIYTGAGLYAEARVSQGPLSALGVWFSREVEQEVLRLLQRESDGIKEKQSTIKAEQAAAEEQLANLGERIRHESGNPERQAWIDQRIQLTAAQRQRQKDMELLDGHLTSVTSSIQGLKVTRRPDRRIYYPAEILGADAFDPPLCEICQMRQGQPFDYATVTDYLCDRCYSIRQKGFSQRTLSNWLEGDRGQVAWLQVSLRPDEVEKTVASLFARYVDQEVAPDDASLRAPIKANLRLTALVRDFALDYGEILRDLDDAVKALAGSAPYKQLTAASWVTPINSGGQVYRLLACYCDAIRRYFPVLWESAPGDLPFRLGLSIGPAHYPFYQHWRYVGDPPAPLSVRQIGHRPLEIGLAGVAKLLTCDLTSGEWQSRQGQTYLHRLAGIERKSGSSALAAATFLGDVRDRKRDVPGYLKDLEPALTQGTVRMVDLLAYYQLTTFGERR